MLFFALAGFEKPTLFAQSPQSSGANRFGALPLAFEANQGQTDAQVRFLSRGQGYSLFLTDSEAVFVPRKGGVVRMQLAGASRHLQVTGVEPLHGKANYFIGKDPSKWRTNIPTYGKVKFDNVYRGIDLVYYGNHRQLEYDFIVAPGANPKKVSLHFPDSILRLAENGDLVVHTKHGDMVFLEPVVYQSNSGEHQQVEGHFRLLPDNSVGFALGKYDPSKPLVIDPSLAYSTLLGGGGSGGFGANQAYAIAVDAAGNAYVTGYTGSTSFPTTGGTIQPSAQPGGDAFATKINASGTALVYSTYLGDNGSQGFGIAVDSAGDAFVTGSGSNVPTTPGAFQPSRSSTGTFVTKLDPTGSALVYSTWFPATIYAIAVDTGGNAYLAGAAAMGLLPTTPGAFQTAVPSNGAFITKLNPEGTALVYSSYVGSQVGDRTVAVAQAIALDGNGDAFIGGYTDSPNFPVTAGAFQSALKGTFNGFVTEMNSSGTALKYSTYVGGSDDQSGEGVYGLAVDGFGSAYASGTTTSSDFPVTPGAFQTTFSNGVAAFAAKLNPDGSSLAYSTYVEGTNTPTGAGSVFGLGIAVDAFGDAIMTGETTAPDFPVTSDAFQSAKKGPATSLNGFLSKLNPNGTSLIYSTYIGGSSGNGDYCCTIALDPEGNAYIAGYTFSNDFPTTEGAFQTLFVGTPDAFVTKFGVGSGSGLTATSTTVTADVNPQSFGATVNFVASVEPPSGGGVPTGTVIFSADGTSAATTALDASGHAGYSTSSLSLGSHTIGAAYSGDSTYSPSSGSLIENIVSGTTFLFGNITGKSGPAGARAWNILVSNNGPAAAVGAEISSVSLSQVGGAACNPTVTSPLPGLAGNLARTASATATITIDFSSCAANARFTANIALSANGGNSTGSIIRLNQFQ
jgi:hypothetical protein